MTLLKKLLIATSMVLFTSIASAESFDLGDVTGESVFGISNEVVGAFEDTATFTLTAPSEFEAVVFNFSFATFSAIEDFTISIMGQGAVAFSEVVTQNINFTLAAGTYDVFVTGDAGTVGSYAVTVSPVPEASTIALMLSGLGFVSFVAKRRRKL
jgi:hypothetical protein